MAKVTLDNVSKIFGEVEAVKGISLDVEDKEFLVLLGPSGCGKSTTLRMIAGLEELSEGNIYIGEKRVNDVPPRDRDIAMVFQDYALYPHMTVYQNMAFGLKLRKRFEKSSILPISSITISSTSGFKRSNFLECLNRIESFSLISYKFRVGSGNRKSDGLHNIPDLHMYDVN